jgi:CubicO group peptidase (beta-lactamase class C family)
MSPEISMPPEETAGQAGATAETWRSPPYSRWAFHNVREVLPVADIAAAPERVLALPETPLSLDRFVLRQHNGAEIDLDRFLELTASDALVILHDGRIVYETYANGTTARTPHIFMSVTKAMTGLIAGILSRDGALDLEAPASTYVPEIAGSGFAGATVRQLLDMRTGVVPEGEAARAYDRTIGRGASLHQALPMLQAPRPHGGPFSYISANTDLAGWVMERASGQSFAELVSERLWKPMGAEHGAYIVTDAQGSPWCSGGFCATARDFARVGELVLDQGLRGGEAILPETWIDDLREGGDRKAWATGEWGASFAFIGREMSYRSGWYSVHSDPKVLFAMGTHGQNLFVDRANRLVVAKLSSQPNRIDPLAIALTHAAVPEFTRLILGG